MSMTKPGILHLIYNAFNMTPVKEHPFIHPSSITTYPLEGRGGAGLDPSWHWVRRGAHSEQVASQSQGWHIKKTKHSCSHSHLFRVRKETAVAKIITTELLQQDCRVYGSCSLTLTPKLRNTPTVGLKHVVFFILTATNHFSTFLKILLHFARTMKVKAWK